MFRERVAMPDRRGAIYQRFGYEGSHFVCYFYAVNWLYFSLGVHISLENPNVEIHLPVGFLRIGRK